MRDCFKSIGNPGGVARLDRESQADLFTRLEITGFVRNSHDADFGVEIGVTERDGLPGIFAVADGIRAGMHERKVDEAVDAPIPALSAIGPLVGLNRKIRLAQNAVQRQNHDQPDTLPGEPSSKPSEMATKGGWLPSCQSPVLFTVQLREGYSIRWNERMVNWFNPLALRDVVYDEIRVELPISPTPAQVLCRPGHAISVTYP
jgi:hypothetical protein